MSQPKLKIGNTDFTEKVMSITPANHDLDADGSGRDIHTGTMYRTKITDKDTLEVAMMRLWEDEMPVLAAALSPAFVSIQYLDPKTNALVTKDMYCSELKCGLQIYNKTKGKTYYEGATFQITEK